VKNIAPSRPWRPIYPMFLARKHNKAFGRLAGTPEETIFLHKQGYDLLCYSGDLWVYQQALIAGVEEIRAKCKT
jgi:hypothetical protein